MATYEEYIAQGKTPEQIANATKAKYGETSSQYMNVLSKAKPAAPAVLPVPSSPTAPVVQQQPPVPATLSTNVATKQGGVSDANYAVMNDRYKQNMANGMTKEESVANVKGTLQQAGVYDQVKAQYEKPPVTPTVSAPVKPNIPPTPSVIQGTATAASDMKKGEEYKNQVKANLLEGSKNDKGIMDALATGDEKTFKQRYDYDTANNDKRAEIDAFWKSNSPQTADEFFFAAMNGMDIGRASSPDAAIAKHRMDAAKAGLGMSADDLKNQMVGGKIVEGSEQWNDMLKANGGMETPSMTAAKANAKKVKDASNIARDTQVLNGTAKPETPTTDKQSDEFVTKNGIDYAKMYKESITDNKDINDLAGKVTEADKGIADLEASKKATLDSILADHPGLPTSLLYSLVESRNAPIDRELEGKRAERDRLAANLKYKTEQAKVLYDAKVLSAQERVAYLRDLAKTKAEQEFAKSQKKEDREFTAKQTADQREWETKKFELEQAYKNPDINSKDPAIASIAAKEIIDREEEFARKYGIPTSGKDFLSIAKSYAEKYNLPLSDALYATYIEPRHNGAEYKAVVKAVNEAATTDNYKPIVVGANSVIYDPKTGKFITPPSAISTDAVSAEVLGNKWFNAKVGDNVGVECARFATNGVGLTDVPGGDDLQKRKDAFTDTQGTVGGLVLFSGGGYDPKYGHMAIVKSVNPDGTITVKESNFHGDKRVTERTIPTTYVSGYYNNTPLANAVGTQSVLPKDAIEKIASYEADISKYLVRATPQQRGAILKAVSQVNPNYDESLMSSVKKEKENWTSSKANTTGGNIVALNQAIHHMRTLEGVSKELNNGDVKAANKLLNSIGYNTGGAEVSNFSTAAQSVASEVAKVFRGAGSMSVTEIEEWKKNINPNMSKEQYEGFLKTTSKLLEGRLSALESSWHGSFGKNVPTPKPVVDEESRGILDGLLKDDKAPADVQKLVDNYFKR